MTQPIPYQLGSGSVSQAMAAGPLRNTHTTRQRSKHNIHAHLTQADKTRQDTRPTHATTLVSAHTSHKQNTENEKARPPRIHHHHNLTPRFPRPDLPPTPLISLVSSLLLPLSSLPPEGAGTRQTPSNTTVVTNIHFFFSFQDRATKSRAVYATFGQPPHTRCLRVGWEKNQT